MHSREINSLAELEPLARELADLALDKRVLTFSGDLGAGKTTLIQHICRELGVEEAVTSPSFGLVNEYESAQGAVYHFDLYRIRDAKEALELGFLEYVNSGNICLIEWPEIVLEILPSPYIGLRLQHLAEGKRSIAWSEM